MAKHPQIRELIKEVQQILGVEADGLPGPHTEFALDALMEKQNRLVRPVTILALLYEHLRLVDKPLTWTEYRLASTIRKDDGKKPLKPYVPVPDTRSPIPSQKPTMPSLAAPWLDWALGHLGEKEDESEDNNPFILALWDKIGIKWTHTRDIDSKVPWCAALVGAALAHTGYAHTASGLARSYLSYGIPLAAFRRGCILIWPRGSNPRAGHVDFGVELNDGIVETVGGNVKNQVSLGKRPIKEAIGMRFPTRGAA